MTMPAIDISEAEFKKLSAENRGRVVIIDVREPDEFEIIRFRGSRLFPIRNILKEGLNPDPASVVILVCRTGSRSYIAAHSLKIISPSPVYNLANGIAQSYREGNQLLEYGKNAKMINDYFKPSG